LRRAARTCGDIGAVSAGAQPFVLVNSTELAHAVLVEHADAFEKSRYQRQFGTAGLGNGLVNSSAATHRRQRRVVAPAFEQRRVLGYAALMAAYAEQLQVGWADGAIIDIVEEMQRLTLRIVGMALFSVDVLEDAVAHGAALTLAIRAMDAGAGSVPDDEGVRRALAYVNATIAARRAARDRGDPQRDDMLTLLLDAHAAEVGAADRLMTDSQVRDEVLTMFIAGHENPRNALTWAWYLLSRHPHAYARIHEELTQVLGDRAPSPDDLAHLLYTLQVFKEALRLYPPAYVFGRQALRSVIIGGYTIPEGVEVLISPYLLHRRPDYFPDPERFDPQRFAPEAEQRLPHFAFLPFGGGPRGCIGYQFALIEGQMILAALARHVRLELAPGQQVEPEPLATLRPRGPIMMQVRRHSL
jgi:cytochrome P450